MHSGHTAAGIQQDAMRKEITEAPWVAAEMCAGGAYAHSALALGYDQHTFRMRGGVLELRSNNSRVSSR